MNTNLLDFNHNIFNIIGDYAKQDIISRLKRNILSQQIIL